MWSFCTRPAKAASFSASRRLAARAMELLPRTKTGVLWLEDDWVFNRKAWLIRFLMERKLRHSNSASRGQLLHCAGLLEELQARLDAFQARGHPQWYFFSSTARTRFVQSRYLVESAVRSSVRKN